MHADSDDVTCLEAELIVHILLRMCDLMDVCVCGDVVDQVRSHGQATANEIGGKKKKMMMMIVIERWVLCGGCSSFISGK